MVSNRLKDLLQSIFNSYGLKDTDGSGFADRPGEKFRFRQDRPGMFADTDSDGIGDHYAYSKCIPGIWHTPFQSGH